MKHSKWKEDYDYYFENHLRLERFITKDENYKQGYPYGGIGMIAPLSVRSEIALAFGEKQHSAKII